MAVNVVSKKIIDQVLGIFRRMYTRIYIYIQGVTCRLFGGWSGDSVQKAKEGREKVEAFGAVTRSSRVIHWLSSRLA